MIDRYIDSVCNILDIPVPAVSFDTANFASDTMMAQCSADGHTIFLKKCDGVNPDQLFAIAHELRHIWQVRTDWQGFFESYKPVNMCTSVETYNLQPAEVDANAFAGLIMIDFFGLEPLFQGVPESVRKRIFEHMEKLEEEY